MFCQKMRLFLMIFVLQFALDDANTTDCPIDCLSCVDDGLICTRCENYLYHGNCLNTCPDGTFRYDVGDSRIPGGSFKICVSYDAEIQGQDNAELTSSEPDKILTTEATLIDTDQTNNTYLAVIAMVGIAIVFVVFFVVVRNTCKKYKSNRHRDYGSPSGGGKSEEEIHMLGERNSHAKCMVMDECSDLAEDGQMQSYQSQTLHCVSNSMDEEDEAVGEACCSTDAHIHDKPHHPNKCVKENTKLLHRCGVDRHYDAFSCPLSSGTHCEGQIHHTTDREWGGTEIQQLYKNCTCTPVNKATVTSSHMNDSLMVHAGSASGSNITRVSNLKRCGDVVDSGYHEGDDINYQSQLGGTQAMHSSPTPLSHPPTQRELPKSPPFPSEDNAPSSVPLRSDLIPVNQLGELYLNACVDQFHNLTRGASKDRLLTTNFTNKVFASGLFNHEGGHLRIEDTGVDLFIPPGAIPSDGQELKELYIFLNMSQTNRTGFSNDSVQVTPVVHCGPPGTKFLKPVILTIPHCIQDVNRWQDFCLMTNDTHIGEPQLWERLGSQGHSNCFIHEDSLVAMIDGFSDKAGCAIPSSNNTKRTQAPRGKLYAEMTDEDKLSKDSQYGCNEDKSNSGSQHGGKKLRVGLYMAPDDCNSYNITCYLRVWNDTPADQHVVEEIENKRGRQKCCATGTLLFDSDGGDLLAQVISMNPDGWTCVKVNPMQIPNCVIWENNYTAIHEDRNCTFSLKYKNTRNLPASSIRAAFQISQKNKLENSVILHLERDLSDQYRTNFNIAVLTPPKTCHVPSLSSKKSSNLCIELKDDKKWNIPLPIDVYWRVCEQIEPNECHSLARELGLPQAVVSFIGQREATQYTGTSERLAQQVLDIFLSLRKESSRPRIWSDLYVALQRIGKNEASWMIDKLIKESGHGRTIFGKEDKIKPVRDPNSLARQEQPSIYGDLVSKLSQTHDTKQQIIQHRQQTTRMEDRMNRISFCSTDSGISCNSEYIVGNNTSNENFMDRKVNKAHDMPTIEFNNENREKLWKFSNGRSKSVTTKCLKNSKSGTSNATLPTRVKTSPSVTNWRMSGKKKKPQTQIMQPVYV